MKKQRLTESEIMRKYASLIAEAESTPVPPGVLGTVHQPTEPKVVRLI